MKKWLGGLGLSQPKYWFNETEVPNCPTGFWQHWWIKLSKWSIAYLVDVSRMAWVREFLLTPCWWVWSLPGNRWFKLCQSFPGLSSLCLTDMKRYFRSIISEFLIIQDSIYGHEDQCLNSPIVSYCNLSHPCQLTCGWEQRGWDILTSLGGSQFRIFSAI